MKKRKKEKSVSESGPDTVMYSKGFTRQKLCADDHQISFGRFDWKLLDGWKLLNWPGKFEEFETINFES